MKKIALFFLLLISVSYAEFCERPYKPDCVNKTSANESEFNACKQNMEKYLIKVDSFIACLENTNNNDYANYSFANKNQDETAVQKESERAVCELNCLASNQSFCNC